MPEQSWKDPATVNSGTVISLEDHVVASSYEPLTGVCRYVLRLNGALYTVDVPLQHFERHPPSQRPGDAGAVARRGTLHAAIEARLKGPPDPPLQLPTLEPREINPARLKPPGLQRRTTLE